MNKNLITKIFLDRSFHQSKEVYHFLAGEVDSSMSEELIDQFYYREQLANIQIDRQTILPHLESDKVKASHLLILRLQDPISSWNNDIKEVKLIICLVLKRKESPAVKEQIRQFMIGLAKDTYVETLLAGSKSEIEELL